MKKTLLFGLLAVALSVPVLAAGTTRAEETYTIETSTPTPPPPPPTVYTSSPTPTGTSTGQ